MPKAPASRVEKEVPEWISVYFHQAHDSQIQLIRVVSVSRRGIEGIVGLPRLTQAVARVSGKARSPELIQALEEDAVLAKSESEKDFPVLHSLATIGMWSWLEHLVKGLLVGWILHNRSALRSPALQKIKVRISDYSALTKQEQAAHLLDLVEQETAASLKIGINRFESLLDAFGLSGRVNETTSRALFELQQVRNAIAHQNGRCDRRLRTNCPWLKLKIGAPINVSSAQLSSYANACTDYALTILFRLGDLYGVELRTSADDT